MTRQAASIAYDVSVHGDPMGRGAILSRATTQRAVLTSRDAVLRWMMSLDELPQLDGAEVVDDPGDDDRQHWHDRNWSWSIDYYLWSRRIDFVDRNSTDVQAAVLAQYREVDGSPPSPRTASDDAIALADPSSLPHVPFRDVALRRATVRAFRTDPLTQGVFSSILWRGLEPIRRARLAEVSQRDPMMSFGAAFDFVVLAYRVEDIRPGAYWYDPTRNALTLIRYGAFDAEFDAIIWGQGPPLTAAATLIVVADFHRYQWRYRHERALRNLYVDAGRTIHPLLLVAAAHHVGCFPTPATNDTRLAELLGVNHPHEAPLYSMTFGPRRRQDSP